MVVDLNHSSRLESYHRKNEMNDREGEGGKETWTIASVAK